MPIVNVDNVLLENGGVESVVGWEYTNCKGEKDKLIVEENYIKFYTAFDYDDVPPAYIYVKEIDKLITSLTLAKEYFQKKGVL